MRSGCWIIYLKRWRIEDFFRVLKSGCKVESVALRVERAGTIWCEVAWRIMVLTLLGRTVPELDAKVFFTEMELRFLTGYVQRVRLPAPEGLQQAILVVAVLGGYQNRSRDGPPGHQIMWRGMDRLSLATLGYEVRYAQHSRTCLSREASSGDNIHPLRRPTARALVQDILCTFLCERRRRRLQSPTSGPTAAERNLYRAQIPY